MCVHLNVPHVCSYTEMFVYRPSFPSHYFSPFRDVRLVLCCYNQCQAVYVVPACAESFEATDCLYNRRQNQHFVAEVGV